MRGAYLDKVYRKLHTIFWHKLHPGRWSLFLYSAYRKYIRAERKEKSNVSASKAGHLDVKDTLYLTQVPNKGAGIGHQMGNWNSGYWYAQCFGVQYAYSPFSNPQWDAFLGFGEGEVTAEELLKQGYKKRKLPYFDGNSKEDLQQIQGMIDQYRGQKVVFFLELDQFYEAQCGVMKHIKEKFYKAQKRKEDVLRYQPDCLNIAVHIRRGDIVIGQTTKDPGLTKRWLPTEYSANLLKALVNVIPKERAYRIYLFSQGTKEDFPELEEIPNIEYCLDMPARESFLHMVMADILITSKSSFSYKPALLSNGIKICPKHFWHAYPQEEKWIIVDEEQENMYESMEKVKLLI